MRSMIRHSLFVGPIWLVVLISVPAQADQFNAYAPPNVWSPYYELPAHAGAASYVVSYRTVGSTLVIGEIEYVDSGTKTVVQEFRGSITIRTGNAVARPKCRFKAIVTGSAIVVNVK